MDEALAPIFLMLSWESWNGSLFLMQGFLEEVASSGDSRNESTL